jgi:hypothetical protein
MLTKATVAIKRKYNVLRVRKLLTSLTNHRVRHCEGVLPEAISALSGGDCFVGKCALLAMTKTRGLILLQTLRGWV